MPLLCIGNGGSGDAHYNEVATERPDDSISAGHTRLLRIASAFGAPTTVTTFVLALLRDPTPSAQLSRLTNSACIDLPKNYYAITIANLWGAQDPRSVGSRLVQALPHRPGCFFLGPSDTSRDCRKTNYSLALSFYLCSARKEMRRRGRGGNRLLDLPPHHKKSYHKKLHHRSPPLSDTRLPVYGQARHTVISLCIHSKDSFFFVQLSRSRRSSPPI